ncbi:hypothetical protein HO133_008165 [Letharia lupina]|uniref:Uncharacterized protein n=1 Tax=Letharia lupina TaxID=560253 RepID=A0A8H6CRB3_9LECA|nr:uncharacterized protein HO133_008165 [Letharia lupina]KAF6228435.1 hypothetical protein HO133_008165 [Letharia lupina]
MTHFSKEGEGKGFPKGKTGRGNAHAEERDDVAITAKSRDARGGEAAWGYAEQARKPKRRNREEPSTQIIRARRTGGVAIDEISRACAIRDPLPVHVKTAVDAGCGAGDLRDEDVAAAGELDVAAGEGGVRFWSA